MRLYKRGDIWWIRYDFDGKDTRISTHLRDKAAAQAVMDELRSAQTQSRLSIKSRTLEDIVRAVVAVYGVSWDDFISRLGVANTVAETRSDGLLGTSLDAAWTLYEETARALGKLPDSPTTVRKRRCAVERFVEWVRKERSTVETIEAVDGPTAAGFAQSLARSGLKTKTRKNIIGDLSTVWIGLSKCLSGIANPWSRLAPRDVDGEVGQPFSAEEEVAVLKAAKRVGKYWYEVCLTMQTTGLRYGDVANLTWSEIDFDEGVIRVTPNKSKRHKIRVVVAMLPEVRSAIEAIREVNSGDYLFPVHAEVYSDRSRKSKVLPFREVLDAAGIHRDGITIHSWRHTAATRLAEAGVDKETRKRILGHTVDATSERYDHDDHIAENRAAQLAAARVR